MAALSFLLPVLALLGSLWADELPPDPHLAEDPGFACISPVQEAAGTALRALGWCEGSVGLLPCRSVSFRPSVSTVMCCFVFPSGQPVNSWIR